MLGVLSFPILLWFLQIGYGLGAPEKLVARDNLPTVMRCCLEDSVRIERNVRRVKSIVVTRIPKSNPGTLEVVADVVRNIGPSVKADIGKVTTDTEDLPGDNRGPRCLILTWSSYGPEQEGDYKCEIHAINKGEQSVDLSYSVVGTAVENNDKPSQKPVDSTEILKNTINSPNEDQEKWKATVENDVKLLKQEQDNWRIQVETKITQDEISIESLKTQLSTLRKPRFEIGSLEARLYESGPQTVEKKIIFSTPYTEIPMVNVAIDALDVSHEANLRIKVTISNEATTGFTLQIYKWGDTSVYWTRIRWTSYGI